MLNFTSKKHSVFFVTLAIMICLMMTMMVSASAADVERIVVRDAEISFNMLEFFGIEDIEDITNGGAEHCYTGGMTQPTSPTFLGHLIVHSIAGSGEANYGANDSTWYNNDVITFLASDIGIYTFTSTTLDYMYTEWSLHRSFQVKVVGICTPTNISLSSSTIMDYDTGVQAQVGTLSTTDADNGDTFTYSLVSGDGSTDNSSFLISGSNLLTANSLAPGNYSIRVRTTDLADKFFEKAFTITVQSPNTAPTDIALTGSTVAENAALRTTVGTFSTTDTEDTVQTAFAYTLVSGDGSTDNGSFTIEGNVLKLNAVQNFESKSSLSIRVETKDSGNATFQKAFTITVTNVNESPDITSGSAVNYAENGTGIVYTAAGTDPEGDSIAWSISGTDAALFDMDPTSGALTFSSAPDFEAPSDAGGNNIYDLTIVATSAGSAASQKSLAVTVTNVNEAPSITSEGTATFAENGTGTVYTGAASDVDAGSTFTWEIGGTDSALFTIGTTSGLLSFNSAPNFESPQDADGNNIYSLNVTVSDGALTDTKPLAVTVTNVNESPVITSGAAVNYAENGTGVVYTATGTDPEDESITWSIGGTDAALFEIDANSGELTFIIAPNYEVPNDDGANHIYDLTIIATSAGTPASQKSLAVTVTNVNEAPAITSGLTAAFDENGIGTVYTGMASDVDVPSTFVWTISGADAALFTMDSVTGQLAFIDYPNYEQPADTNGDNIYSLTVTVSDGELTDTKSLSITVNNVNEPPTAILLPNMNVTENASIGTEVTTLSAEDEDAGNTFTYALVDDKGGEDNASFTISGNKLLTNTLFDYDTKNSYNIRIQCTDNTGLSRDETFTISIDEFNYTPTNITLSNAQVNENTPAPCVVGSFGTVDANASTDFTYMLVSGTGDTDNACFTIDSGVLQLESTPNYEVQNEYSIRVRTTDIGNLYFEKQFTITVNDVAEAPVITSPGTVDFPENAVGTVYTATSEDEDAGASATWSIIGGTDAGAFSINSATGQLTFNAPKNFESPESANGDNVYSVILQVSDGALSAAQGLDVTVTNVNETPSDITLPISSVPENTPVGTAVSMFSTTDLDVGDTFTYTLVPGTGDADNTSFTIVGSELRLGFTPNFEAKYLYHVLVRTTDQNGLYYEKTFTVTITDVNEAPTDIQLSGSSIPESAALGTAVGTLSAMDQDAGDAFTFTLVPGEGDTDNGSFTITGNTLYINTALDYYVKSSCTVRVRSTDKLGLYKEKYFSIAVTEVNSAPTDLTLSNGIVTENIPVGSMVGTLATTDRNLSDTFTYTLVSGEGDTDNACFTISGNELKFNVVPDYEEKSSYALRVRTTDSGNLSFERRFVVTIVNANDAPVITSPASFSFNENSAGTVFTADCTDVDSTNFAWSMSGVDASYFTIDSASGTVVLTTPKDFEAPQDADRNNLYEFLLTVSDGELTAEKAITILFLSVNEPPIITSSATAAYVENGIQPVYIAAATDVDGDAVTWQLSGADASRFHLDSITGVLSFLNMPDYELPGDNGANNIYDLILTASSKDFAVSQALSITVSDMNEAPVITSASSVRFTEGGTGVVYTAKASDPEGAAVTFSIGGTDASLFTISSAGSLSFKAAPLYYSPADNGGDNVYNLTLTATDASAEKKAASKALSVTVIANTDNGAEVIVNDVSHSAGAMETVTGTDGRTTTTVTVDEGRLSQILNEQGEKPIVIIPITTGSNVASGVLTGQMVKAMEQKEASLVVQTQSATYTLPTTGINIDTIASQLGQDGQPVRLSDITIRVEISEPSPETVSVVESAANAGEFSIVVPAVAFTVTCTYQDTTVEVKHFNAYAERMIPIPDGVDPQKITTGVTVLPDGTTYSVPTKIIEKDGRYYAIINSLTNSVYTVIWHPVAFSDVMDHPAKDIINDMGSRMVVTAIDEENNFAPDTDISSGEFVAVVIRALGLAPETVTIGNEEVKFSDLTVEEQYAAYVKAAVSRNLFSEESAAAFDLSSAVSREQAMILVAKAMEITKLEYTLTEEEAKALVQAQSDAADISADALSSIAACIKTNVLFDNVNEAILPKANVTRAEAAVIVQKLLQASDLI